MEEHARSFRLDHVTLTSGTLLVLKATQLAGQHHKTASAGPRTAWSQDSLVPGQFCLRTAWSRESLVLGQPGPWLLMVGLSKWMWQSWRVCWASCSRWAGGESLITAQTHWNANRRSRLPRLRRLRPPNPPTPTPSKDNKGPEEQPNPHTAAATARQPQPYFQRKESSKL